MMINLNRLTHNLRIDILKMVYISGIPYVMNSFALIDLISTLYFREFIKCNPLKPQLLTRDYFLMNIKSATPALYSVLGEIGFFIKDEFFLYGQINELLNTNITTLIPGIENNCGHTEKTFPEGLGLAWGLKNQKLNNHIYLLIDKLTPVDFISNLKFANKYKLDNFTLIFNIKTQTPDKINLNESKKLFKKHHWEIFEIKDGHDHDLISQTFTEIKKIKNKPQIVFIHTTFGKGVLHFEDSEIYQTKILSDQDYKIALSELEATITTD